ncbi:cTAGE family member 5 [Sciurus carolinensis]|uniref:CTAGE family member 5 n=1 Tax=Sciurus carolinensis TaxID=30640 RepID=A0AA41T6M7_SCICA|nr:cTAGE family member 5 [Sciurus carolinensis]
MEGPRAAPQPCLGLGLEEIFRVASALPEDVGPGPNPDVFLRPLVICAAVGFFVALLFLWRSVQSFRSRFSVGRKLALKVSELLAEKCKLLEKFSLVQKGSDSLESSLKDVSFVKESVEEQTLEATYEKLNRSKSKLEDEILILEKELKEEKSKRSEQDELMVDIAKTIKSLEEESKSLKSQVSETKTTFRLLEMNKKELKVAIKEALSENNQLRESHKLLLQEAKVWKEKVSDLHKQKITLEDSKVQAEEVLRDTEKHIKCVTERLLQMKDGAPVPGEDLTDDGNLKLDVKSESEIGAHLGNQPKGALKELVHAVKLNASLKTLGERNQIYTSLSEVDERKEDLTELIKNLETEGKSLQSENRQFENENQKLQQKLKLMMKLYEENEVKLLGKLIAEEECWFEEEERLCKMNKRISLAAKQLETCRKQAKDLEEELESTIHFYERQILFYDSHRAPADTVTLSSPWEPDSSHPAENQAAGSGFVFVPLVPVRNPSLRVSARRNFMRRGSFLPPPPLGNMYGACGNYFPRGPPPLPFPV